MSRKTLLEIYTYIQKYLVQKNMHPDYIDFYELYNLDSNNNIEELKTAAKKIRKLFHPDQKIFIDSKYESVYDEILNKNNDLYNIIENENNKINYDNYLRKQRANFTKPNDNYQKETQNNKFEKEISTEEVLKILERITETMTYKYNFSIGFRSLEAAVEGDLKKVTRENNCRQLLKEIGTNNIKRAIKITDDKSSNLEDNLLNFYTKVIERPGLIEKTQPFFNACKETAKKYGSAQLSQALNFYLREKVTKFFTNDHNVRTELENANYPKEDITMFIYTYLYKNKYNLSASQELTIDELLYIFSDLIESNLEKSR